MSSLVRTMKNVFRNNLSLILFVVLLATFRGAIADWHPVPTGSMKPTILEGDVIWHNKLAYDLKLPFTDVVIAELGEPQRGDIVVLNSAKAELRLVKRVIGLPGDTITIVGNQLLINGELVGYQELSAQQIESIRLPDRELGTYAFESLADSPNHTIHLNRANLLSVEQSLNSVGQRFVVPEEHFFLLGDNRDNSADSRHYGAFPRHEIRGRATHVLLSLSIIDSYKPRFERFLSRLN